jgi:hypothetical protein
MDREVLTVTEHDFTGLSETVATVDGEEPRGLLFKGRTGANANLSSPIYNSVKGNLSNSPNTFGCGF